MDAAFGDILTGAVDELEGSDFLAFAGVARPRIRVYPRETHIAEKVHAYTLPRKRPNSRVKDLPDIALLSSIGPFEGAVLRSALERTFNFRASHPLPSTLPEPPSTWLAAYARMAVDDGLRWRTLAEVTDAARAFLAPVLAGELGTWDSERGGWDFSRPR